MYDCQLSIILFITPFCVEEWTREIRIVPRTRIQEFFVFYVSLRIIPSFSIEITRRIGKNEIFNLHVHYAHRSSSRQKVQRINSFDASIYISLLLSPFLTVTFCKTTTLQSNTSKLIKKRFLLSSSSANINIYRVLFKSSFVACPEPRFRTLFRRWKGSPLDCLSIEGNLLDRRKYA